MKNVYKTMSPKQINHLLSSLSHFSDEQRNSLNDALGIILEKQNNGGISADQLNALITKALTGNEDGVFSAKESA